MDRRTLLSTFAVVVVTAALIAALIVRQTDRGGSAPIAGSSDRADTLEGFVAEAVAFIEATKGMPFVETPVVVALAEDEFVARVDADLAAEFAENPERVEMYNAYYRAFGLIGPDESIDTVYRAFGEAGILGFYDPETDELVVRRLDELSLLTKSTIVHELTHAYDDQHYDLDRPEYDDRVDEVPWTFTAVVEGSASHVEELWEDTLSRAERSAVLEEELGFGDPTVFDRFELEFLWLELSVYESGEPFARRVVGRGGFEELGRFIEAPPPTSEQVLVDAAFTDGEVGSGIDPPEADGEIVAEGVGGQILLESLFVGAGLDFTRASNGWGDDRYVIWREDQLTCLRWDLRADTPADLEELESALTAWLRGEPGVVTRNAETIRVERCV